MTRPPVQLPPVLRTSALPEGMPDFAGDWVYRCYGQADGLLYVGVTHRLYERLCTHRREAVWFKEVERITAVRTLSAYTVERRAILAERPRHNRPPRLTRWERLVRKES